MILIIVYFIVAVIIFIFSPVILLILLRLIKTVFITWPLVSLRLIERNLLKKYL